MSTLKTVRKNAEDVSVIDKITDKSNMEILSERDDILSKMKSIQKYQLRMFFPQTTLNVKSSCYSLGKFYSELLKDRNLENGPNIILFGFHTETGERRKDHIDTIEKYLQGKIRKNGKEQFWLIILCFIMLISQQKLSF